MYKKICLQPQNKTSRGLKTDYRLFSKENTRLMAPGQKRRAIASRPVPGNIFNLISFNSKLQTRKIKDVQFHSTMKFGFSLALAIILTPLFLLLTFVIFSPWWISLLIFLTIPLAGLFSWYYYLELKRIIGGFRIKNYLRTRNREYIDLKRDYDELLSIVTAL